MPALRAGYIFPDYLKPRRGDAVIFSNPLLEKLTKTHPAVPPVIYLPIIAFFIWYSIENIKTEVDLLLILMASGFLFWTFTEYMIHRFVFHFNPGSQLSYRIQFIIHGVHHRYPRDRYRLVMPPAVSLILAGVFWMIFKIFIGIYAFAFFPGFLLGYIIYDMIHYAIHHFKIPFGFLRGIWKHHLRHHYRSPDKAFGVSVPIWDYIFKTMPE
jgi:sterol desaturase/sphingolipid hydroxylase (fatty acid hydroxylase superfamily)